MSCHCFLFCRTTLALNNCKPYFHSWNRKPRKLHFVAGVWRFALYTWPINGSSIGKAVQPSFWLVPDFSTYWTLCELSKKQLQLPYYFWADHRSLFLLRSVGLVLGGLMHWYGLSVRNYFLWSVHVPDEPLAASCHLWPTSNRCLSTVFLHQAQCPCGLCTPCLGLVFFTPCSQHLLGRGCILCTWRDSSGWIVL